MSGYNLSFGHPVAPLRRCCDTITLNEISSPTMDHHPVCIRILGLDAVPSALTCCFCVTHCGQVLQAPEQGTQVCLQELERVANIASSIFCSLHSMHLPQHLRQPLHHISYGRIRSASLQWEVLAAIFCALKLEARSACLMATAPSADISSCTFLLLRADNNTCSTPEQGWTISSA